MRQRLRIKSDAPEENDAAIGEAMPRDLERRASVSSNHETPEVLGLVTIRGGGARLSPL